MCLSINCSCYSACIRVLPLYPFYLPFFSSQLRMVTICGRHVMASVRDIKIAVSGTFHAMPCLPCYEMSSTLLKLRRYSFHVSRYGVHVSWVYSLYFPYWLDGLQKCFSCCSLFILLCNGQNIAEYEAYWIISVPINNYFLEACVSHSFLQSGIHKLNN